MEPATLLATASLILAGASVAVALRSRVTSQTPETRLVELHQRLDQVETQMPQYRLAMESLVDRADEVLDTAERKRRRAAARESKERQQEGNGVHATLDQLLHTDPEQYREIMRRGGGS